jgi:hypothetical protein
MDSAIISKNLDMFFNKIIRIDLTVMLIFVKNTKVSESIAYISV